MQLMRPNLVKTTVVNLSLSDLVNVSEDGSEESVKAISTPITGRW